MLIEERPRAGSQMQYRRSSSKFRRLLRKLSLALTTALLLASFQVVHADEGGVSFWLPGQFGSLAAVPQTPGWSLGAVYYHTTPTRHLVTK